MKKFFILLLGIIVGGLAGFFVMAKIYDIDIIKIDVNNNENQLSEYANEIPFSINDKYVMAVIDCNLNDSNEYFKNVDSVKNIDKINLEGQDKFIILPKYANMKFYVYRLDMNENAEFNETFLLETSNALYICCNPSDLYSNVKIVAEYKNKKYEYSPWYSLKDGSLSEESYVLNVK